MAVAIPKAGTRAIGKGLQVQLKRASDLEAEQQALFDKIVGIVSARQQWPSGHTEDVISGRLRGQQGGIYLRNSGGWIVLSVWCNSPSGKLDRRYNSQPLPVACPIKNGWQVVTDFTRATFDAWRKKCAAEMDKQR